jgi:hypothetical protein
MTPRAEGSHGHAAGRDPRLSEARASGRHQIEMRPSGGSGEEGLGGKLGRHLGPYLVTTPVNGRSEDRVHLGGVSQRREPGLEDSAHQAAPSRVQEGNSVSGRRKQYGETIRGPDGEEQASGGADRAVAVGDGPGSVTPHDAGAVYLTQTHGRAIAQGPDRRRAERTPGETRLGGSGGKWLGAQHVDSSFDAPPPVHDARA